VDLGDLYAGCGKSSEAESVYSAARKILSQWPDQCSEELSSVEEKIRTMKPGNSSP
jgi:hypothetical protein